MKISEIITETTAGGIATVIASSGPMIKRPNPSVYRASRKKKTATENNKEIPMRAVRGKNNVLSLIGTHESKLYDLIELRGFLSAVELSERDAHLAENMYIQNVIKKVRKNTQPGYTTYASQQKNSI